MGNSNKAKPLSIKLIKNANSREFEKSGFFKKTKEYICLGIREGKCLNLLKTIETEKGWKMVRSKMHVPIRKLKYAVAASVLLIVALTIFLNKDETNSYTTLVAGKVSVKVDPALNTQRPITRILAPSQQSNLDFQSNDMRVTTVNGINSLISRKDGVFDFERKPLKKYYDSN
ncbi:hypothetical protein CJ739_1763 [Mariniflexile rhizosphaerae]|uniref:hypothetical protein n=1 Tax=unclassified Mariniflexile TaxID=2643887 RepID=UPI000E3373D1|nr:hypothetical protein [Mariniflexile sp. TRM1-10]AXP80849.1 hypothetical protein CJ739_1763 [Mariniflexile sp. TRM1-10]